MSQKQKEARPARRKNAEASRTQTWRRYQGLIDALAELHGVKREHEPAFEEQRLEAFIDALQRRDPRAHEVLAQQGLSANTVVKHFRYIPNWDADRRRMLAQGAPLRLMERYAAEGKAGHLHGLTLDTALSTQAQDEQLRAHLNRLHRPAVGEHGWLSPRGAFQKGVRRLKPVWLYTPDVRTRADELSPTVARSLISTYLGHLKEPGVVIDPMAASGSTALEAARMGHWAWASDLHPQADFVAKLDLDETVPALEEDSHDDLLGLLEKQGAQAGDLVILHPPVSGAQENPGRFARQVRLWLEAVEPVVKGGGHLVLVISAQEAPGALELLTRSLVEVVNPERQQAHGLTAHHLAVATDGSQAWHLLVAQRPV